MKISKAIIALAGTSVAVIAGATQGAVIFSGSSGSHSATASFEVNGAGALVVTLTNDATADTLVPSDLFTAIFFDVSGGSLSLTRDSVVLAAGSSVEYGSQPAGGVVGGEWGYVGNLAGAPAGAHSGISSTGVNLFSSSTVFPGGNLAGPADPDGPQYGLASAGDNPATGNGGITGSGGLIKNSVVVTLGGAGTDFDLSRIGNVLFFYGTAVGEGQFEGHVPTPGAAALVGIAGLTCMRRRQR